MLKLVVLILASVLLQLPAAAEITAQWNAAQNGVMEAVTGKQPRMSGNIKFVSGIEGRAVKLDGFTAHISQPAESAPKVPGAFTVESWLALGCYPLFTCPVIDHLTSDSSAGYSLDITDEGKVRFRVAVDGKLQSVTSSKPIPFRKWQHIAGSFDPEKGLTVYVNGRAGGSVEVRGSFTPAENTELLIGRSRAKKFPAQVIRPVATGEVFAYFDGIIDGLRIVPGSPSAQTLVEINQRASSAPEPDLPLRVLPMGPKGPGKFGAYYTKLKFYEEWDALWRVSDKPDVVVRFDDGGHRFIFWRGTSYIPCWATENGIWYSNEFNETWYGVRGCAEPMSDKQCRYSHVRIIESSPARVVIHWRYALVDNFYTQAIIDPLTGWGDWSDEFYTIYPDGIGTRKIVLHSSEPLEPHEFQESFVVLSQGQRPEACYNTEAVTMVNLKGETKSYSWEKGPPDNLKSPAGANIQLIHIKSRTRPFIIVSDKPVRLPYCTSDGPVFRVYSGEIRREYSIFPWWNHWPVSPNPSDGRWACAADRIAHSSVSTGLEWEEYELTPDSRTRVMLHGLTHRPAPWLAVLGRSWLYPPKLAVDGSNFENKGYDVTQRAFVLARKAGTSAPRVDLQLAASEDAPLVNPAFVVKNWGGEGVNVLVNGKALRNGTTCRVGRADTLEGTDLIVWLRMESASPVKLSLVKEDE